MCNWLVKRKKTIVIAAELQVQKSAQYQVEQNSDKIISWVSN